MNIDDYIRIQEARFAHCLDVSKLKGHDYSGTVDTLRNLKTIESDGLMSAEKGILVRLHDKFMRLAQFTDAGVLAVTDEKIEDTLTDIINYATLFEAVRAEKNAVK